MKRAVVLWGGGLDSTTLLFSSLADPSYRRVRALYIRHGCQAEEAEIEAINIIDEILYNKYPRKYKGLRIIQGSNLQGHPFGVESESISPAIIPARNTIFATTAFNFARSCGYNTVSLGIQAQIGVDGLPEQNFPDCSFPWLKCMRELYFLENAVLTPDRQVNLEAPFIHWTKIRILERAIELAVPVWHTWSCYYPGLVNGRYKPCGKCEACLLRMEVGL